MDEELEKLYLQNIEEYIFDEDKIVTYKWLSKTLNVHVNTAKQLLYTFSAEVESNRKPELQLTYLVGGTLPDGKGCRFQVVREDDLPKVKNQFKVVTSEHIYSIHKSKRLPDLNVLYGIDSIIETEDGSTMQGSIRCKKSVRRLEEQLAELRLQSRAASLCGNGKLMPQITKNNSVKQKPKPEETTQSKEKPSLFTMVSNKPTKTDKEAEKKSSEQVEPAPNAKKSKPSGTIASMFSAQSSKAKKTESSEQKKTTGSEESSRETTSKAKDSAGSITSMFPNQTSKSKSKTETKEKTEEQKPAVCSEANKKDIADMELEKVEEKPTAKRKHQSNEKAKPVSKGKSKKLKKSSSSDSSSQPAKKRKRIMVAADSDSSDDDIFGGEDEDVEEDSRSVEPAPQSQESDSDDVIPSTPQPEVIKGHRRKRKLVDKTFTDEDGYIITKKEYVFESCSGSEGEEEKGKENEKAPAKPMVETAEPTKSEKSSKSGKGAPSKKNTSPKKKPSAPQKGKQTSLMSFFKKN